MKFSDLLNEKFKDGFDVTQFGDSKYVEVFENPTKRELSDILKNQQKGRRSIRFGATDEKQPKIYAWDGNIMHNIVLKQGILFDFGFYYEPDSTRRKLSADGTITGKEFDDLKHKEHILKAIKNIYPEEYAINTFIKSKPVVWDLETGKEMK